MPTPTRLLCLLALLILPQFLANSGERINHAGRILGPAPVVTTPTLFNTTQGDSIISAMQIFPRDNAWYDDVSTRPVLSNSDAMITKVKADLAAKGANRQTLRVFTEMNYVFVPDNQPKIDMLYVDYPDESDDLKPGFTDIGSLPIPTNMPVETWPVGTGSLTLEQWQRDINNNGGDRHSIMVMPGAGYVWETWQSRLTNNTPNWQASNCAKFNLNSNALRPDGWTSGDAAGLSMFPALIRYDECARGEVEHAVRLIVGASRNAYLYPASHRAGSTNDVNTPAMGQRFRLKSSFVIPSNWHPYAQAVARAMKKYGLIVADNGGFFSVSCTPDNRFPSGCFSQLQTIDVNNFEVVQGYGATEGPRSSGAPTANAGVDFATTLAAGANLSGTVTGTNLTVAWYAYPNVVQPGNVTFGTPSTATTTATFSAAGTYTLMLRASDGVHTPAYDAVVVTVSSGSTDTTPPTCSITTPTSNATHSTATSPLNIGGTASDNIAVTQVQWTNDRGGAGTASGTTAWSINGITLQSGQNVLTVTARDAAGNAVSDTLTVAYTGQPPTGTPAAPSGLSASATSATSIALQWVDNANDETGYELERSLDSTTFVTATTLAANTSGALDANLAAATGYYYRVRATGAVGSSGYSNVAFATTMSNPGGGGGGGGGTTPGQGTNDDFDGDGTTNAFDADDDNDGMSDSDEIAAGTDPFDFFSGPATTAMNVSKLSGGMKFGMSGKDGCSVSGVLPGLPSKVELADRTLTINIGGAAATFLLNAKGQGKSESGSIVLKLKPSKRNKTTKKLEFLGGDVAFKSRLFKGTWSDDWADEGASPADAKNKPVAFVVTLNLGGKLYTATANTLYSAKAGKTGRMKL